MEYSEMIKEYRQVIINLSKIIERVKELNVKYNISTDTSLTQSLITDFNKHINNVTS
jgi:hypothetical protein